MEICHSNNRNPKLAKDLINLLFVVDLPNAAKTLNTLLLPTQVLAAGSKQWYRYRFDITVVSVPLYGDLLHPKITFFVFGCSSSFVKIFLLQNKVLSSYTNKLFYENLFFIHFLK